MNKKKGTKILHPGLEQTMHRIMGGPAVPEKPFIDGKTHGDVFTMARAIVHACPPENNQRAFLGVFTEERATIAAAILAAMAGGPILIFPHDISNTALMDLTKTTGMTKVLANQERLLSDTITRVCLNPAWGSWAAMPLNPLQELDAPLLKLHTGGSTGKPSIWTKTLENIMAETEFHIKEHGITSHDVIVATVPPYHIYGLLFSVVIPLITGASVLNQTPVFPQEIINAIAESKATLLAGIPAHYRALKGHSFQHHCLRLAFSSAGVLDSEDEVAFREETGIPVMEVYGSTETGGIAFRCRAREELFFSPFDRIEIRIENNKLNLRSQFISPEISRDDQGFYLVPDRVENCPGNTFAILGRSDNIVKIAGKRVDLANVKAFLKKIPGVRDAFVYTVPVPTGRQFDIYALIEGDCNRSHIRKFLADSVESAAHPRRFRVIETIPITRAGKYDRSAIESLFTQKNDAK